MSLFFSYEFTSSQDKGYCYRKMMENLILFTSNVTGSWSKFYRK